MPRYSLIDDSDPNLVYGGEWTALTTPLNPLAPEYNHTVHATNDPNATITYHFYGTIVNFYGSLNAPGIHGYPNASYTIQPNNLVPLTYFNSSGAVRPVPTSYLNVSIPNVEMFKSGKFAEGNYTLTVRTVGVSPGGPTFYFDYLAVQCGDDTFTEYVILDDNDQQWDYEGTWITGNKTGEYRNTMHVTPKSGGSVSLGFHGTEIAVYGSLTGPYLPNSPIGYFNINGGPAEAVYAANISKDLLLANGTEMLNQEIWHTSGLLDIGQGEYTITMSIPPPPAQTSTSSNSASASDPTSGSDSASTSAPSSSATPVPTNPPWSLDYVVYGPSSALTAASSATPTPTPAPSSPPSAGAIAGGVLGSLAALFLLFFAFLFWRRRERAKVARTQVKEEFTAEYAPSTTAAASQSRPTLSGRRSSIRKGSRGRGVGVGVSGSSGALAGQDGPVLDISATSPLASLSGHVGTSTVTGPGTADSDYDTEYMYVRRPVARPVREMDGGVRLASGSDIESEVVDILPPSYARYGSPAE